MKTAIARRRGVLTALLALGAVAALLYHGAVWLLVERVRTMPEVPPPTEASLDEDGGKVAERSKDR
ncbi:MAG: hypothetical protein IJR14_00320 [Synergistaceae bacterium]|nr:hypothetical protein [Synergistaceae bacterium]